jgi:ribosomal protein S18 acetylase RimI-like enzyme
MEDAKKRSFISIEPSQMDFGLRLFKEVSGGGYYIDTDSIVKLSEFLASVPSDAVLFEDARKPILSKLLSRAGYEARTTYEMPKRIKTGWLAWNDPVPDGMEVLGVAEDAHFPQIQSLRRLSVLDRSGPIGEMMFSDFGRFARAKANPFGSEGFGRVRPGTPPSVLITALVREMLTEKKRYLILGPEYSAYVGPVHSFPLWHMVRSSPGVYEHSCREAKDSDLKAISTLVSEYEDIDQAAALANVTRTFYTPSYRFLISAGGDGFALLKFSEGAIGMINDLYVTPASQGAGVGDDLTRASLTHLSLNCIHVHLNTIYPRAKRLYEKYGFKVQYRDYCVALNQNLMVRDGR